MIKESCLVMVSREGVHSSRWNTMKRRSNDREEGVRGRDDAGSGPVQCPAGGGSPPGSGVAPDGGAAPVQDVCYLHGAPWSARQSGPRWPGAARELVCGASGCLLGGAGGVREGILCTLITEFRRGVA